MLSRVQGGVVGALEACMPTQTRDSLSRCLKELHSDAVPKDLAFLLHHGQALRPTSALGWLAAGTVVTWALSIAALLCAVTLGISIAGLFVLGFVLVIGGSVLAFTLGMMALCLAFASFAAALVAGGGATLYTTIAGTRASLGFASAVLRPAPRRAPARVEEPISIPPSPKLSIHVPAKTREKHQGPIVSLPLHEPPSPAVKPVFIAEEAEDGEDRDIYLEPSFVRTNRGF